MAVRSGVLLAVTAACMVHSQTVPLHSAWFIGTAQEASFSVTDGAMSGFWGAVVGSARTIRMDNQNSCVTGFCHFSDVADAEVAVKLAWGQAGLYALFEVKDNSLVTSTGKPASPLDEVSLWFDQVSGTGMGSVDLNNLVAPTWGWAVTTTSRHVGSYLKSNHIRYEHYSNFSWTHEVSALDSLSQDLREFRQEKLTSSMSETIELRIPWVALGLSSVPQSGTVYGFSCEFWDGDVGQDSVGCLAWRGSTPYVASDTADTVAPNSAAVAAWGDLELSQLTIGNRPRPGSTARVASGRTPVAAWDLRGRYCGSATARAAATVRVASGPNAVVVLTR